MGFYHRLKEGTEVYFRPIQPSDKDAIQRGLELLSDESKYTRFFAPLKKLTEKQLIHLTEVDQVNHVAWVCLCPEHPEIPGLGVCRFVRNDDNTESADFAITVIDAYQNHGLGTEFLALLYVLAEQNNLKTLIGSALFSNLKLVERFKNLGAKIEWKSGTCDIILPILTDYSKFPNTKYTNIFVNLLNVFKNKLSNYE